MFKSAQIKKKRCSNPHVQTEQVRSSLEEEQACAVWNRLGLVKELLVRVS